MRPWWCQQDKFDAAHVDSHLGYRWPNASMNDCPKTQYRMVSICVDRHILAWWYARIKIAKVLDLLVRVIHQSWK